MFRVTPPSRLPINWRAARVLHAVILFGRDVLGWATRNVVCFCSPQRLLVGMNSDWASFSTPYGYDYGYGC